MKRVRPGGEIGDVDDRGSVLLEEAHSSELIGLELPLGSDDESRVGVNVGEEQGQSQSQRSGENEQRV